MSDRPASSELRALSTGNRLLTNGAKVVSLRAPWITSAELYDSDEEAQSFQRRSFHSIWWQVFAAQSRSNAKEQAA